METDATEFLKTWKTKKVESWRDRKSRKRKKVINLQESQYEVGKSRDFDSTKFFTILSGKYVFDAIFEKSKKLNPSQNQAWSSVEFPTYEG